MVLSAWRTGTGIIRSASGLIICEACPCDEGPPDPDPVNCNVCLGTTAPGAWLVEISGVFGTGSFASCADRINGTYIVPFFTDSSGVCQWLVDGAPCCDCVPTPGVADDIGEVSVAIQRQPGPTMVLDVMYNPKCGELNLLGRWRASFNLASPYITNIFGDTYYLHCCDLPDEFNVPTGGGSSVESCFLDGATVDFSAATCTVTALGC